MDPNATLENLRLWVERLHYNEKQPDYLRTQEDYSEAVESFEALDEWLTKGGFLPEAWQTLSRK